MSLHEYLRGARSRPNPEASWVLWQRHAEGGPWFVVDRLGSQEGASDWLLSPTVALDHGDLVRLLSPEKRVAGFWVQGRSGLLDAGPVPGRLGDHELDWEAAWEGAKTEADEMLRVSRPVDLKRRVLAAADCAETALVCLPERETRPRKTIEVARAWVRGEVTANELRRANEAAATAASQEGAGDSGPLRATFFAAGAVLATVADTYDAAASNAAFYAGNARSTTLKTALAARRALAPLVRRWLPLPIVLLARAGEPTPLNPSELARV